MLIYDPRLIGNKLYEIRKKKNMTQAEVAELAEISDRTYADIERGSTNMRIETAIKICCALHITPNEILTEESSPYIIDESQIKIRYNNCTEKEKQTALQLLNIYFDSLK